MTHHSLFLMRLGLNTMASVALESRENGGNLFCKQPSNDLKLVCSQLKEMTEIVHIQFSSDEA